MEARRAVLLVTETADLAADLLVLAAARRRLPLIRFNQDEFSQQTQISWQNDGHLRVRTATDTFTGANISGAWFRRMPRSTEPDDHIARFAFRETSEFLGGIWAIAPWFWMNRPPATMRAEHKLLQLEHARKCGLVVPATLATNCPDAARTFVRARPSVAKTLAGGRLIIDEIDHAIFTNPVTIDDLGPDHAVSACPVLFQERIDTAFDLRVTVIDDRVFGARIILRDRAAGDLDWRQASPQRLLYERHALATELEAQCCKLVAALGLTYGALDFVVTSEGKTIFLEVNPAGQWGWIERALGLPITDAILDRLQEG